MCAMVDKECRKALGRTAVIREDCHKEIRSKPLENHVAIEPIGVAL